MKGKKKEGSGKEGGKVGDPQGAKQIGIRWWMVSQVARH